MEETLEAWTFSSTASSDVVLSSSRYGPLVTEEENESFIVLVSSVAGGVTCAVHATTRGNVRRARVRAEKGFMEETMGNICEQPKATISCTPMQRKGFANGLLTVGVVFVFGYFGIDKFVHPQLWIGWLPDWMSGLLGFSLNGWLSIIGFLEILFALMLLIPVRAIRQAGAVLCALHLVGVLTQTGWNDIAVRDIGLLLMCLGLFALI